MTTFGSKTAHITNRRDIFQELEEYIQKSLILRNEQSIEVCGIGIEVCGIEKIMIERYVNEQWLSTY